MQNTFKKIIWIVIVLVIMAFGVFYLFFGGKSLLSPQNEDSYQAVFLTNGQAYFGKLSTSGHWLVLGDVYYLEAKESLQAEGAEAPVALGQQKIQLVKLGAELHGPEAEMFFDRDKVLFWENMKDDSKVLEAIKQFKGGTL